MVMLIELCKRVVINISFYFQTNASTLLLLYSIARTVLYCTVLYWTYSDSIPAISLTLFLVTQTVYQNKNKKEAPTLGVQRILYPYSYTT